MFPGGEYKIVGLEKLDGEDRKRKICAIVLVDGDVIEVDTPFLVVHSRPCRRNPGGEQGIRLELLVGVAAIVKINGRRYDERNTE